MCTHIHSKHHLKTQVIQADTTAGTSVLSYGDRMFSSMLQVEIRNVPSLETFKSVVKTQLFMVTFTDQ